MFATFPLARGQRQVPATLAACVIHGVGIAAVVIFAGTQLKAAPTVDPYEKIVFVVPPPAAGHSDGVDAPGAPKAAPWPSITPEPLMLDDLRAMTAVETGSLIGPPVPGALVSATWGWLAWSSWSSWSTAWGKWKRAVCGYRRRPIQPLPPRS